jgi:hypothetical protein
MFPVKIKSGLKLSILFTFFFNNSLAIFVCKILYVQADPQQICPSGISIISLLVLLNNAIG